MSKIILVSGGAGFIGNCFCKLLLKEGKERKVINVDACTYAANPHTIDEELKNPKMECSITKGANRGLQGGFARKSVFFSKFI